MAGNGKQALMHCEARHALKGRVRVYCRGLKYLSPFAGTIAEDLNSCSGIRSASISTVSATVLVFYDPDLGGTDDITEQVAAVLGAYAMNAFKAERAEKIAQTVQERRLQEEPMAETLKRIAITGGTLGFSWLRPGSPKPGILGRFLNISAMTAVSLAIPIFKSGLAAMAVHKRPNADTLSASAIIASVAAGQGQSALTIILLADIAELLTAYTMDRTRQAIRDMLSVGEDFVWRIAEDGSEERVALSVLKKGDRVISRTGEKISVDGVVESGDAAVDQAAITGEFMPVHKQAGDEVFAGTVIRSGRIVTRADKVGDRTAVARIVTMVEEAADRKAVVQTTADRISGQFIPVNFMLAAVVWVFTGKVSRALNMLIIDYSCGVRLSTATALSAAICTAAKNGVLIKGSNYLEALSDADTVIFDKTGTLTEGRPVVSTILCTDPKYSDREVMCMAAAAEEASTHPMALAILGKVRRSGWVIPKHTNNQNHTALGVSTKVGRSIIRVGSKRFMESSKVRLADVEAQAQRIARKGENVVYVARGRTLAGVIGIQDVLREDMKKSLNRLRHLGIDDIILLTGDVEQHAEIVAMRMAMDRYHAEVLPDEKAETVLRLQSKGTPVVMVGDGINDAPALAYADVGVAMGKNRTDIAMEAADITIAGDDPLMIPSVARLSQRTMNIVRQNFATAIGVNTLGIMLASVGVLPVFWGAVLHNSCTVAVVLNSSRLLIHDMESGK
ncbi:MAG: cation-translocating P-type ATPase [Desulfobacterales bacterium]|nr:cation-translocating P-type ATPase [Desulfobacterales bacterium]